MTLRRQLLCVAVLLWASCATDPATDPDDISGEETTQPDDAIVEGDTSAPIDDASGPEDVDESDTEATEVEPYDFSTPPEVGTARAGVIEDAAGLLLGPKSEGKIGDLRIDNGQVAFVIEALRRSSGYSYWGGNVTDAGVWQEEGGFTADYFGELFFVWNLDVFKAYYVEIVDDGRVSGAAHIRYVGSTELLHFAEAALGSVLNLEPPELDLIYDYTLGADDDALTLTITLQNTASAAVWVDWPIVMSHAGDGVFNYVPEFGFADVNGQELPYFGLSGREISYALYSERDDIVSIYGYAGVSIFQVEGFEVPKKSEVTRTYNILASDNGPAGLDHGLRTLRGTTDQAHAVTGTVTNTGAPSPVEAWVVARRAEDDAVMSLAPVAQDGSYAMTLGDGDYHVTAYREGHAASQAIAVTLVGEAKGLDPLVIPTSASVRVSVTEVSTGLPTAARVTFIRTGETPSAYAPQNVRPAKKTWSGDRSAVAYVTGPEATVSLPAGTYDVTASRGPTHEREQRTVTVVAGEETELTMSVEQVIDTTGWLSGDFHIHAYWSPDSYVPWHIRARQAATEDLDLPILTEHVYIGSLQGVIEDAGVGGDTIGIAGQEVTTFTHGHFNAFPLEWRPEEPSGGAVYPHDKGPLDLFEAIRDQHAGDEIIQINHPRGSDISGYFSFVGLNADQDTVQRPADWSANWDAIEVFNGGCGKGDELQDWIGLTNHGYRKALASGSDSHGENGLIGTPRNWIQVDAASVRADSQALVAPIRARRSFVSCGPFVRFEAIDAEGETVAGLGDLAGLDANGDVHFHVKVEAPTWITLNEVRLWENGQVIRVEDITTSDDPILRFDAVWTVTPMADAWYAVEVIGSGSMAPVTWSGPPYALTNPIEVDQDGDGDWTPPGAMP